MIGINFYKVGRAALYINIRRAILGRYFDVTIERAACVA
jgi:hypothetical protein